MTQPPSKSKKDMRARGATAQLALTINLFEASLAFNAHQPEHPLGSSELKQTNMMRIWMRCIDFMTHTHTGEWMEGEEWKAT